MTRRTITTLLLLATGCATATTATLMRPPAGVTAATAPPATAPALAPAGAADGGAKLVVRVADVRSAKGNLVFGVFRTGDGFPSDDKKSVAWAVKPAGRDVSFECVLPPGDYAASVLHDENANNKMDQNVLGIPTEGYGVTNNPKPKFRAATFKEAAVTVPEAGAEKTISLQYF